MSEKIFKKSEKERIKNRNYANKAYAKNKKLIQARRLLRKAIKENIDLKIIEHLKNNYELLLENKKYLNIKNKEANSEIKKQRQLEKTRIAERKRKANRTETQKDKDKLKRLKYLLKSKYNATIVQYLNIIELQSNCCAICNNNFKILNNKIKIDHNHITGKIRGLLCNTCNIGLGKLKEDRDIFLNAIKYITYWNN